MVKKMLDHPLITLRLGQSSVGLIEIRSKGQVTIFGERFVKPLIYTGMIDQLFDYCAGELPYRSLKFVREHHKIASYQPAAVVNYTGNEAFTRITEFRKITGQHAPGTTIFKEYPGEYQRGSSDFGTPYYPKFTQQAQEKYLEYKKQADQCDNLFLCGRLATYKYLDMDDAVAGALDLFDNQLTAFLRREACGSR
jgi:UDP-galactopyranose mutase